LRSLKERGHSAVPEIRGHIHEALRFELRTGSNTNPASSLAEYHNLFRSIGLPPVAKDFQNDYAFANMRVAGRIR